MEDQASDDAFEEMAEQDVPPRFHRLRLEAARSWRWMADVWTKAPSELKIMTVLLPILLAMAVSPSMPKVKIPSGGQQGMQSKVVADRWSTLNKSIIGPRGHRLHG